MTTQRVTAGRRPDDAVSRISGWDGGGYQTKLKQSMYQDRRRKEVRRSTCAHEEAKLEEALMPFWDATSGLVIRTSQIVAGRY